MSSVSHAQLPPVRLAIAGGTTPSMEIAIVPIPMMPLPVVGESLI
jgi:hypothetical protein